MQLMFGTQSPPRKTEIKNWKWYINMCVQYLWEVLRYASQKSSDPEVIDIQWLIIINIRVNIHQQIFFLWLQIQLGSNITNTTSSQTPRCHDKHACVGPWAPAKIMSRPQPYVPNRSYLSLLCRKLRLNGIITGPKSHIPVTDLRWKLTKDII